MKVVFWGVRGSVPTPLTPAQVRSRIAAVLQRARPRDLEDARSRELFMDGLPQWVFATDAEVKGRDFQVRQENRAFFEKADLLILDSQHTLEESFARFDFGHTACAMAVNLAVEWKVKRLVLFHLEPRSDDSKIHGMVRRDSFHLDQLEAGPLGIHTTQEGLELTV